VNLNGTAVLRFNLTNIASVTFINDTGGIFNQNSTAATPISDFFTTGNVFDNRGMFNKIAAGTQNIAGSITFNNSGTVNVDAGTLRIDTFPSNNGILDIASGTVLDINGAAFSNVVGGIIQGSGRRCHLCH